MLLKKAIAVAVTAALLITAPGAHVAQAVAASFETKEAPVMNITPIATPMAAMSPDMAALNSPLSAATPTGPGFAILPAALPATVAAVTAAKTAAASANPAAAAMAKFAQNQAVVTMTGGNAKATATDRVAAGSQIFDLSSHKTGSFSETTVLGTISGGDTLRLARPTSGAKVSLSRVGQANKDKAGSSIIATVGIVAAVIAVVAAISKPFRAILARAWNVILGALGIGVKKAETPEILAQRIVDELNAAKPEWNRKVAEASELVAGIEISHRNAAAEVDALDKKITALLSSGDKASEDIAKGLQASLNTKTALRDKLKGDFDAANKGLDEVKAARVRFFNEREQMLAEVQSQLSRAKQSEIKQKIADLKGGFQIGDVKDNMDKLKGAVDAEEAKAKGKTDSVESNPDEIIKKAEEKLGQSEVDGQIAERKKKMAEAAQKNKDQGGSNVFAGNTFKLSVLGSVVLGIGFFVLGANALLGMAAVGGLVGIFLPYIQSTASKDSKVAQAFVIGATFLLAAGIGGGVGFVGATMFTHAVVMPWLGAATGVSVLAMLDKEKYSDSLPLGQMLLHGLEGASMGMSLPLYLGFKLGQKLDKKGAPSASDVAGKAQDNKDKGGSVLMEIGIVAAVIAVVAAISKPFRAILARAWNVLLGALGIGVKKAETPEILAQRIVDELNAAKPEWNRKVAEASELVAGIEISHRNAAAEVDALDKKITALLSSGDKASEDIAKGLQASLNTKTALRDKLKGDFDAANKGLDEVKASRVRFFNEREQMLAEVQSQLSRAKQSEIKQKIADLKGGFQIGDVKDNMDKLKGAVDAEEAKAKGKTDSVESNPDEIIKKAEEKLGQSEVDGQIAERKKKMAEAAQKNKDQGGSDIHNLATFAMLGAIVANLMNKSEIAFGLFGFAFTAMGSPLGGVLIPVLFAGMALLQIKAMKGTPDYARMRKLSGIWTLGSAAAAIGLFATGATVSPLLLVAAPAVPLALTALAHWKASKTTPPSGPSLADKAQDNKDKGGSALDDHSTVSAAQAEQGLIAKTYNWMTLGLGLTAGVAYAAVSSGIAATILASTPVMIGLAILELGLVIGLSFGVASRKLSGGASLAGFLAYAGINGLFMAPLISLFTAGSVAVAFAVTAGMFGGMALLGHTTKKDLTSVGSYGLMALWGIILASIGNAFIHSTGLGTLLSYATVLVFVGLTAYDAQKIKQMAQDQGRLSKDDVSRIAVMGALNLYLDFINIFIEILKLYGKAKSKD